MQVPEWSGQFWQSEDGEEGYVEYHAADDRTHPPPSPQEWELLLIDQTIEGEAHVFRRRK